MGLGRKLTLSRSGHKKDKASVASPSTAAAKPLDGEVEQQQLAHEAAGREVPDLVQGAALAAAAAAAAAAAVAAGHAGGEGVDGVRQDVVQDAVLDAAGAGRSADPGWQLTGSWLQRARDELHEDPDTNEAVIARLRALVEEDAELHARTDDAFLIRFLRARKFNVAKAHKTLQRYYQMKRKHPNLFRADNVDRLSGMMAAELHGVLEGRDRDGCPVLTVRIENYDGGVHTVDDFFRLNVVALEQVVRDPETQVSGVSVIVDLAGFGIQHAAFLAPYYVKNTSEVIQESFPLRFKGFHVVNQPFYFAALFAIIKPFLKEKMKRRVVLHGTRLAGLQEAVPAAILPERYGGPADGFQYQRWASTLRSLEGYFSSLESFGYPEEGGAAAARRLSLFALGRRHSQVSTDGK